MCSLQKQESRFINALYNAFRKGEVMNRKSIMQRLKQMGGVLVVCHTSPDPADRFLDLSNIQVFILSALPIGII